MDPWVGGHESPMLPHGNTALAQETKFTAGDIHWDQRVSNKEVVDRL